MHKFFGRRFCVEIIMANSEERRRESVCNFRDSHPDCMKSRIVKHFSQMGESQSTIYNILSSYSLLNSITRKPGSGKVCTLSQSSKRSQLKTITAGRVAKSYRQLGNKFNCDGKTMKKYLQDMEITKQTRKVKPTVSENQKLT